VSPYCVLVARYIFQDGFKLSEHACYLHRRRLPSRVQHPVIFEPQTLQGHFLQAKGLPNQTLRSIPVYRLAQCLPGSCYSEAMVRITIGQDKDGKQRRLVTFALTIYFLKIAPSSKTFAHRSPELLRVPVSVVGRRQALAALCSPSLKYQPSRFARHSRPEAMRLCASPIVWLKSAFRHRGHFSR